MDDQNNLAELNAKPKGNIFFLAWQGLAPLALVWWGFGIPLKIITIIFNSNWIKQNIYDNKISTIILVELITIILQIIISIMAWRCAPNTEDKSWKWVARGVIILGWCWFFYSLHSAIQKPPA